MEGYPIRRKNVKFWMGKQRNVHQHSKIMCVWVELFIKTEFVASRNKSKIIPLSVALRNLLNFVSLPFYPFLVKPFYYSTVRQHCHGNKL